MNLDRIKEIVHARNRFMQLPDEQYQAIAEATLQAEVEIVTPTSLVSPAQVDAYIAKALQRAAEEQAKKAAELNDLQEAAAKLPAAPIVPAALADLEHHEAQSFVPTMITENPTFGILDKQPEPAPSPAQAETVALEQKPAPAPVIGAVVG